ncbi:MAG TPA: DUF2339 domain-containing protein [Elusimicrobiales bacterium]|nr:DUF2339 domain-containing protein [Elusimicrobiales bacterium]
MKCPKCGFKIEELSEFCGKCGTELSADFRARLEEYLDLKQDLDHLRTVAKFHLAAGIENLSQKIEKHYSAGAAPAQRPAPAAAKPPDAEHIIVPAAQAAAAPLAAAPAPARPEVKKPEGAGFETAMGQKWLLIIGIVATVFGVAYFLKYSFDQGWVGPAGRVAVVYLLGAAFLFGGNIFRQRGLKNYGLYLAGGGIAMLYSGTYAAFQVYHLIGQMAAFPLMVMVTALAAVLAVLYDAKWLAVLGLIGGFVTPLLLSTGTDNQLGLMSYMTVLNLGMLGVAYHKKWDLLTTLGFFLTYILYGGWYGNYYEEAKFWPSIIFVNIFFLTYCVMPFLTRFVRKEVQTGGFAIIIPNSFVAFGFSCAMIRSHFSVEAVALVSVLYAAVFLGMASYAFRSGKQATEGFAVLAGKAMLFLIITVPLIFSKHWITVFWSAQAFALLWMGARLSNKALNRSALALFAVTAVKLFMYDYPEVFSFHDARYFINGYFDLAVARWVTAATFFPLGFYSAWLALRRKVEVFRDPLKPVHPYMFAVFGALFFCFLNIETTGFFADILPAARFAAISVLWTLFSVTLIVAGFRLANAALRKTALWLFMATIIKVFLFDMSNMATPYRIISFMVLGLLLVGTSFLYHKYKNALLPSAAPGEDKI